MKKNVLILGGNGFIGTNLCAKIDKTKYNITSFDINMPLDKQMEVNYIVGDFFDISVLERLLCDIDIVIHAISTVNPGNSNVQYMRGYENDFVQTIRLCELLAQKKIRMIFLSSGGTVYGEQEIYPITEGICPKPINHYGNIKLCIENTLRTFNIQAKTDFIIARIANPYGPGQDYSKGVGFIDSAIKKTIHNHKIEIWGDGNIERDYIYIDDACKIIERIMEYTGEHDTFNISSGYGATQRDILEILAKMNCKIDVEYQNARSVDVRRIVLDNSRIQLLYKQPLVSLQEGIEKYYKFLLTQISGAL